MSKTTIENQLGRIRKSRGIGASELARRVGVGRQTIYAIEVGTYVPNTELALRMARELEVTVDELFSLRAPGGNAPDSVAAEVLSASAPNVGQPVRLCRVGTRWISAPVPSTPYFLPEADGIIQQISGTGAAAELMVFAKEQASQKRLLLAGCDPATSLLANMVEKVSGVEVISAGASSKLALKWLKEGKVHVAGSHLEDSKSGEFNLPFVREAFPDEEILVVTFARWEEGLVVEAGNPKGIRAPEDLARPDVGIVNREPGSGSRVLLDRLLKAAGIVRSQVRGYGRIALGHLPAAYHVLAGEADACLATRSAAQTFGLEFVPLHCARYDLVMRKRTADLPSGKAFLDVLQRSALRRKLEMLAGYDTAQTGTLLRV
jgi:putative molybdopterin biosynthesis protein